MKSLSEGLGDCKALTSLYVGGCKKLEKLPESFEHLKLKDLDLGGRCPLAKKDETYAILAKIPTLTKLSLFNSDMESLSEGIGGLVNLQTLNCSRCYKLESL